MNSDIQQSGSFRRYSERLLPCRSSVSYTHLDVYKRQVLIRAVAQATADGLATVADQMEKPGGTQAANLRVAENYLEQFGKLAKEGNTMILPTDLANISGLVSSLTSVIKQAKA